jgi:hypothetical protein
MNLHTRRAEECANGLGGPALAADHFPEVFRVYTQFQDSHLGAFHGLNLHTFGMIHQYFGYFLYQFLHRVPRANIQVNEQPPAIPPLEPSEDARTTRPP